MGWKIVEKGYTTIKDISSGNFNLHKTFLDELLQVSPVVKQYKRVTDIIHYQSLIVKRYKEAFNRFKEDKVFSAQEIDYIGKVYSNLFKESVKGIDELFLCLLRLAGCTRGACLHTMYPALHLSSGYGLPFAHWQHVA